MTQYKESPFISVFLDEALLGGLIMSLKPPEYWPENLYKGYVIYTCKLSITDNFIGNNYSQLILERIHH